MDITRLDKTDYGAFSAYYKLDEKQGLKLMECDGYTSIKKLRNSRIWRHTAREANLLRKARKRVAFVPTVFETIPVKFKTLYYPGILMEHIEGVLGCEYYKTKSDFNYMREMLENELEKQLIYHDDLHWGNVIVNKQTQKHYVIDFTPEFVEII